eukprot:CAMPEP_0180386106 /NCGR_PEP_ID=MMETSP0989-20121125/29480_1 /TAXON_ID=697907 /ORGANISM="non described non described, Strain CCMP2293" /LENGTH=290 /DNA_ID=CAMNT_0022386783 /DNA_START=27 /DNA_END=899 /DNA_ORIENTATION=-
MTDRFSSSSFLLWMAFSGWLLAPSSSFVVSWLPARGAPALRGLAGAHCRRSCRSAGGALACQQGPRQVGDVVGYVHGGKYQFGEGGDSAGKSLGADYSGASAKQEPQGKEEPFPRWAEGDFSPGKVNGEVRLVSPGDMAEVRIVNEEISWEPFFVQVVGSSRVFAAPSSGTLAPRGGANNVCDPSKPYADTARVTLSLHQIGASLRGPRPGKVELLAGEGTESRRDPPPEVRHGADGTDSECHLVVKTEQRTWQAPHTLHPPRMSHLQASTSNPRPVRMDLLQGTAFARS